jgi:uncharacterized protein YktB (UPF0637 family)
VINAHGIAFLEQIGKFEGQLFVGFGVYFQLEDRIIYAKTVFAQKFIYLATAFVTDYVVGDEEVHDDALFLLYIGKKDSCFYIGATDQPDCFLCD